MKEKLVKFSLEVVIDYVGWADYYSGHGHAFVDEDVVACLRFGIPVTYRETVGDIIYAILDDLRDRKPEFLNAACDDEDLQEQVMEFLTDENLEKAIRSIIPEGVSDDEPFFDVPEEFKISDEDLCELPYLIGYIHVWLEK